MGRRPDLRCRRYMACEALTMWFKQTAEKLRKRFLASATLELEQRTIQIEELEADRKMLVARVKRLKAQVAEDELAAKTRKAEKLTASSANLPRAPGESPSRWWRRRTAGQVPPSEPSTPTTVERHRHGKPERPYPPMADERF